MVGRKMKARLEQVNQFTSELPRRAHDEFKQETPIRTGNARSKTELRGKEIQANYPYAVRLEKEGWSKQAPQGMSEPTIDWIREQLRRL